MEFSNKSGVRESLTGRIGLCRLYPMLLSELYQRKFISPLVKGIYNIKGSLVIPQKTSYKEVNTWKLKGGMPIFCQLQALLIPQRIQYLHP